MRHMLPRMHLGLSIIHSDHRLAPSAGSVAAADAGRASARARAIAPLRIERAAATERPFIQPGRLDGGSW